MSTKQKQKQDKDEKSILDKMGSHEDREFQQQKKREEKEKIKADKAKNRSKTDQIKYEKRLSSMEKNKKMIKISESGKLIKKKKQLLYYLNVINKDTRLIQEHLNYRPFLYKRRVKKISGAPRISKRAVDMLYLYGVDELFSMIDNTKLIEKYTGKEEKRLTPNKIIFAAKYHNKFNRSE